LALAEADEWPSLPSKPWLSAAQGEDNWHRLVRVASTSDIRAVMAALKQDVAV